MIKKLPQTKLLFKSFHYRQHDVPLKLVPPSVPARAGLKNIKSQWVALQAHQ